MCGKLVVAWRLSSSLRLAAVAPRIENTLLGALPFAGRIEHMATINRGVVPVDPNTPVGALRYSIGDLEYVALVPPEAGFGNYPNFSDAELAQFIVQGGDSVTRASGFAYLRFAALAAAGAISWRSDDLSVDSKQMAAEFRLLSKIAFDAADAEDAAGVSGFDLDFPFMSCGCEGFCTHDNPELAAAANDCAVDMNPVNVDFLDGGTP